MNRTFKRTCIPAAPFQFATPRAPSPAGEARALPGDAADTAAATASCSPQDELPVVSSLLLVNYLWTGRCLGFHIAVENGLPLALVHLPHRSGIVIAGNVFPFHGSFYLRLVANDTGIGVRHDNGEIAKLERFHI